MVLGLGQELVRFDRVALTFPGISGRRAVEVLRRLDDFTAKAEAVADKVAAADDRTAEAISPLFGETFGTLYDLSTVAILCLAARLTASLNR